MSKQKKIRNTKNVDEGLIMMVSKEMLVHIFLLSWSVSMHQITTCVPQIPNAVAADLLDKLFQANCQFLQLTKALHIDNLVGKPPCLL